MVGGSAGAARTAFWHTESTPYSVAAASIDCESPFTLPKPCICATRGTALLHFPLVGSMPLALTYGYCAAFAMPTAFFPGFVSHWNTRSAKPPPQPLSTRFVSQSMMNCSLRGIVRPLSSFSLPSTAAITECAKAEHHWYQTIINVISCCNFRLPCSPPQIFRPNCEMVSGVCP